MNKKYGRFYKKYSNNKPRKQPLKAERGGDLFEEVLDLHQRTSEGIKTAKLNGKQIGRIAGKKYTTKKEKEAKEIILKNSKDFNGTNTDSEVIKIAEISRNSYYKYKAELKAQIEQEA